MSKEWASAASLFFRLNYRHVDTFDALGRFTELNYNRFIEQAWMSIDLLKRSHGLTFTLGKFMLPVGFESPNVNEAFVYSRSFTLEVGRPVFGTGVMVRWQRPVNRQVALDIAAYAVNGWDIIADNNDAKTFGGRVGLALFGGDLVFGVSYVAGPEPIPNRTYVNVRSPRHLVDFDILYTGVSKLTLGGELAYGYEDRASQVNPANRARWLSALGTVHYKFLPWLAGSLRYEHFDDPDASRLRNMTVQWLGTPAVSQLDGVPATIESLTVAALFTITQNAHAVLEWRNDWLARSEDRGIWPAAEGGLTKSRRLVALSMYYVW